MTTFSVPNTFTASTVIASSEMNANFTAVVTAFAASLGIDGAETMTGTFKAASGTAALPGITFGVDPDSGIFRKAANTLGFSVAGAEIGNWDASNLNLLGGMTLAAALSMTASSPKINLTDSDTGADHSIDADNASGSMVYSADLNNEVANSTHVWALDGTNQMVLTAAALTPAADDGKTLGTTSLQWADLFLASGAVINFNNGNATLTHSADTLNFAVTDLQWGGVTLATATDVQRVDRQVFTASGTWTKPSAYNANCPVLIRMWGGGGSGSLNTTNDNGGGGGGAYIELRRILSDLGATETVTIGAGGAAVNGSSANGAAGGNTTFGSHGTAYGGAGGTSAVGGGGGGPLGAASGSTPGSPLIVTATSPSTLYLGSGGVGTTTSEQSAIDHGGGGGSRDNPGGNSFNGGGGGAGNTTTAGSTGGTSVNGGDGGDSGVNGTDGTAGTQPAGGGGGAENTGGASSGAGGDGQVEVYVFPI